MDRARPCSSPTCRCVTPQRADALPSDPTYRPAITTLDGRLDLELVDQDPDQAHRNCEVAPGIVHHGSRGEE